MVKDVFVSYSRKDNTQGRVSELVAHIEAEYAAFANAKLECFFDTQDIKSMDDWQHRILDGLRASKILLLVLSPVYLASEYCEWEVTEFLKYEFSRAVQGDGVAQVYFVEIPGLDTPGFEQKAAAWVAQVRRRNHVDLRPWYDEGMEALKSASVKSRMDELVASLNTRLTRLDRIDKAPGNLPAMNPYFVGRKTEMTRLHEAVAMRAFGVLTTAVQGVGGLGKTALAIQYAYADFYPGGRWQVDPTTIRAYLCPPRQTPFAQGANEAATLHEIARRLHERYVVQSRHRLPDNARPWPPAPKPAVGNDDSDDSDDTTGYLDSTYVDANLAQARYISEILAQVHCAIRPQTPGTTNDPVEFTDEEIQIMAEYEHGRWNADRLTAGWRPGKKRDDSRQENPYIVPWTELEPKIKDYDIEAVKFYSTALENLTPHGWEIYRLPAAPE